MPAFLFVLLLLLLFPLALQAGDISYTVEFEGLQDSATLKTLKTVSQLSSLKNRPPASINALRYRAESDTPELLKVLHAHGYYEATIHIHMEEEEGNKTRVIVSIQPGPVYKIDSYTIHFLEGEQENRELQEKIQLHDIGIALGRPAQAIKIEEAELKLLSLLAKEGYPLASIEKREIIADGDTKGLYISLIVQTGPLSRFGEVTIAGETAVKPELIKKKITWKKGKKYDTDQVESSQKRLIDTGLFNSVLITHGEEVNENNELPMHIEVAENKHRSINVGISYQTYYGPGLTFGWENRNIGGLGRKLSLQGDVTKRSHVGKATYLIPDFNRVGQDYVCQAEAFQESIIPFHQRSYSLTNRLERIVSKRLNFAVGVELERLFVTDSVDNGNATLFEIPLYLRLSTANSLLNPTEGLTLEYRVTPSFNLHPSSKNYLPQTLVLGVYVPLDRDETWVFAQKITFSTILSPFLNAIPVPKRVFGGSEDNLRGYSYLTVSPLSSDNKPIGGRSALFYTFETRLRLSEKIGFVPFFDMGNVQETILPTWKGKWFKSVGLGFRYFSFMGPLRFDLGFPLERRAGIDPRYRVLVSIGQMF